MTTNATPRVTVLVPVLGRAHRVASVASAFQDPHVDVLFLPDADDASTINELRRLRLPHELAPEAAAFGRVTYSSKINHGFRVTSTPFVLYASDDVQPESGWWEKALAHLEDDRVGVLATNDEMHRLVRKEKLATHGIVRRSYVLKHGSASLPDAGPIMWEGYWHWCCDCEVSRVARDRGAFKFAPDVILRHNHPLAGRGEMDATYALGQSRKKTDQKKRAARIAWP